MAVPVPDAIGLVGIRVPAGLRHVAGRFGIASPLLAVPIPDQRRVLWIGIPARQARTLRASILGPRSTGPVAKEPRLARMRVPAGRAIPRRPGPVDELSAIEEALKTWTAGRVRKPANLARHGMRWMIVSHRTRLSHGAGSVCEYRRSPNGALPPLFR